MQAETKSNLNTLGQQLHDTQEETKSNMATTSQQLCDMQAESKSNLNTLGQQLYDTQEETKSNMATTSQQLRDMQTESKSNLNTLGQQLHDTQEETKSNMVTTSQQLRDMQTETKSNMATTSQQLRDMQAESKSNLTTLGQQMCDAQEETKSNLNTLGQHLYDTQEDTQSNLNALGQQLHHMQEQTQSNLNTLGQQLYNMQQACCNKKCDTDSHSCDSDSHSCDSDSHCSSAKENLIKFDLLKKHVIETLQTYAVFFRDGKFAELMDGIGHVDPLAEYLNRPENFEVPDHECCKYEVADDLFDQYRHFLFILIDEFKQVVRLTTTNNGLEQQVETLTESDRTLKDLELLKAFIAKYYGGLRVKTLFEAETTLPEPLKIKREYLIYLKRYGAPEGGIFETEKIQEIKLELYGPTIGNGSSADEHSSSHTSSGSSIGNCSASDEDSSSCSSRGSSKD